MTPEQSSAHATIDYVIILGYVAFALLIGSLFVKKASTGIVSFFVGDRKLPWWIAGTSIVATTFAADTPLAVAGIVANDGIAGNWIWWCIAVGHVVATYFFARLWRRSGVITDAEITEVRYGGKPAAFLRGFKAIYFGVFINCLTMAWVIKAMVKIAIAFFPTIDPTTVVFACIGVSVVYTTLGGFRGVVITDVVQFALGMFGSIVLAYLAVDAMGGIRSDDATAGATGEGLLAGVERVTTAAGATTDEVLSFLPPTDHPTIPLVYFIVLLFAGWWRYAEGNGYIVQRLAASKDEGHAQAASLWFAVAHNALRPWPWILVGLCALVVFPKLNLDDGTTYGGPVIMDSFAGTEALAGRADKTASAKRNASAYPITPASLDPSQGGELIIKGMLSGGPNPPACAATINTRPTTCQVDGAKLRVAIPPQDVGGFAKIVVKMGALTLTVPQYPMQLEDRELAYPLLMKKYLPAGLLGLVIASLIAAFMSTIDTHTNWGASYLVNDIYRRFIRKEEDEPHYVRVSRLCIVAIAIVAGVSSFYIGNIASVWRFLVTLGAGLGSVTAARWYWHRVTAYAEIGALVVTTVLAVGLELFFTPQLFGLDNPMFFTAIAPYQKVLLVAFASLATWIPIALFGPREDREVVQAFYDRVRPAGPGFAGFDGRGASVSGEASSAAVTATEPRPENEALLPNFVRSALGVFVVFATLFGIGHLFIGTVGLGVALCVGAAVAFAALLKWRPRR